jgi:hypothetical protein
VASGESNLSGFYLDFFFLFCLYVLFIICGPISLHKNYIKTKKIDIKTT